MEGTFIVTPSCDAVNILPLYQVCPCMDARLHARRKLRLQTALCLPVWFDP